MENFIELKKVNKSFFGAKALDELDFSIRPGEVKCLIGENGCGKSTMIKIISGFYDYDDGQLLIDGNYYKSITPKQSMSLGIQVIYQDFALFPNMTVAENIMMNKTLDSKKSGINWKTIKSEAKKALEVLNVNIDLNAYVKDLGVANTQLVAICRALQQDVRLIIMDEPTTALTHKEVEALYKIVKNLSSKGIAVLFVSHKLDELKHISNSLCIMRNGKNVYDGSSDNLTHDDIVYYMTGKRFQYEPYDYVPSGNEQPVMQVKGLFLENAFEDISFSVYEGEVLGITGLLGCGRTELANSIFGVLPYDGGEIKVKGRDVKIRSVQDAKANKIGYVPENRLTEGLHLEKSIAENAIASITPSLCDKAGFFNREKVAKHTKSALSRIEIAGMTYEKEARALSGGNQQKVVLVKWLEFEPDILILNCPTVGVDVGSKSVIHDIIRQYAKKGMSIIVISDDIPEIMSVCSRVLLMSKGRLVREHVISEITSEQLETELVANA